MYKSAAEKMPLVGKKARVPKQAKTKKREESLNSGIQAPRINSRDSQNGLGANPTMRRIQTLNDPLVENRAMERLDGLPRVNGTPSRESKKGPQRSVRFGDNEVKEFVRKSSEMKYEDEIGKINNRVIITQQKEDSSSMNDSEDLDSLEMPVYQPYSGAGEPSEIDHAADPDELMERIKRLRSLADNILNVQSDNLGQIARNYT